MRVPPSLLGSLMVMLAGCGVDQFESDSFAGSGNETSGPNTDDGSDWSTSSSSGSGDAGDGDGDTPVECDDANKRCDHEFGLADMGYQSVDVIGDFAADGWSNGAAMALVDGTWRATVGLPWDVPVAYKFRINGGEGYLADPGNPNSVDDGFGGLNSMFDPSTCDGLGLRAGQHRRASTGATRSSTSCSSIASTTAIRATTRRSGVEGPADFQGGDWAGVTAEDRGRLLRRSRRQHPVADGAARQHQRQRGRRPTATTTPPTTATGRRTSTSPRSTSAPSPSCRRWSTPPTRTSSR